jgi:hypothetical protein
MKVSLSASEVIEFVGLCFVVGGTGAAFLTWHSNQLKKEILTECKAYLQVFHDKMQANDYAIQERVQANEIEIGHLNNCAEKGLPNFQRLILSIRRRDIDELR